jgi:hypothetical protein
MGYIDEKGYPRNDDGELIHRIVAYKNIYLKNRDIYPLPFGEYVVHHKDGNKLNYRVSNLQLMTQKEHEVEHGYGPIDFNALLKATSIVLIIAFLAFLLHSYPAIGVIIILLGVSFAIAHYIIKKTEK